MIPKPCFIANWKMNKTGAEACHYLERFKKQLPKNVHKAQILLAPPYTALQPMLAYTSLMSIDFAAQNIHYRDEGAYTGEISARMVYEAGCRYAILGHSERRLYFHETDLELAQKMVQARQNNLVPILCVGENRQQRDEHQTLDIVLNQVRQIFSLCRTMKGWGDPSSYMIAYEPVWAIGTGETPQPADVERVHAAIERDLRSEGILQDDTRLLYGGSVNEKNIAAFMKEPHIHGVLVGGASLSPEVFAQMIENGVGAKEDTCTS